MRIRSLKLLNFRNHAGLAFQPEAGLNILVGRNAQGKSAILEAVYLLATSKSYRTHRDAELITAGEDFARVCAEVGKTAGNDIVVDVVLSRSGQKTVRTDGARHSRIADLLGHLNAVSFSTSDIDMLKGEPSGRRRFLDMEVAQASPQYVFALANYKRVMEQRNALLRRLRESPAAGNGLEQWSEQLVGYGVSVIQKRQEYLALVAPVAHRVHAELVGGGEDLHVTYAPSVEACSSAETCKEAFGSALLACFEQDVARGTTGVGPHRDDVRVVVGSLPAREYASEGQLRSAAIAIKLAAVQILFERAGEPPVVLLDDVMAELDDERSERVLSSVMDQCQVMLTTTSLSEIPQGARERSVVFRVEPGSVSRL